VRINDSDTLFFTVKLPGSKGRRKPTSFRSRSKVGWHGATVIFSSSLGC
jgi:hypothetical protein